MWLVGVFVLLCVTVSAGDDGLDTVRSSKDAGMKGLYALTRSFLDDVQSYTFADYLIDNNITEFGQISDIKDPWKSLLNEFLGFAVCIALGIVFVVVSVIVGCCYCCCRTCCKGCCCGKCTTKQKQSSPPKKSWTLVCTGLALATSIIMFSMVVCAYVSGALMAEEFSEGLLMGDVSKNMRRIEKYAHDSADDLDEIVVGNLNILNDGIEESLVHLPDTIMTEIDNQTQVNSSLTDLADFTSGFPELQTALNDMDPTDLGPAEGNLDNQINAYNWDPLKGHLTTCGTQSCLKTHGDIENLEAESVATDLTSKTILDAAALAVDTAINDNIDDQVQQLVQNMADLTNEIENEIEGSVDEVLDQLDSVSQEVNETMEDVLETLRSIDVESTAENIDELGEDLKPYGEYMWFGFFGLSSILLIVTILWISGALMGFGGSRLQAHGANCLLAGVAITFIFSWLIMLLTCIMFALGGGIDVLACRHLVTLDEDAQKILEVTRNSADLDFDTNLTITEILDNCKQDQALYTALRMDENGFNITELLDLEEQGIYDDMRKLKNITFDFGQVDVITDDVKNSMLTLEFALENVDTEKNQETLKKPITVPIELYALKDDLDSIVIELRGIGNEPLAGQIETEATRLESSLIDLFYDPVVDERSKVKKATEDVDDLYDLSLSGTVNSLEDAQDVFNNDLEHMVSEILGVAVDDIIDQTEDFTEKVDDDVRNDLAQCRPVFDIMQSLIYAPCVYLIYNFNALWTCYGAVLFFSIPGIVFATKTVGYYRRMHKYSKISDTSAPGPSYEMKSKQKKNKVSPQKA